MIRGRIDEDGNALVEVTVSGIRGSVMLNGHLDTEFSGDVSLPVDIAVTLGLELVMEIEFELADGSASRQLIFQGVADIGDGPRDVEILLSSSACFKFPKKLVYTLRGCIAADFQNTPIG